MARKQTTDPTTALLIWGIKQLRKLLNALFINFQKKKIEKAIKEKEQAISQMVHEKLEKYNDILELKYKQLTYKDDYGIIRTDKYETELKYFMNYVVDINNEITDESKQNLIKKIVELMKKEVNLDDVSALSSKNPYDFEKQCANILKECGWDARATQKSSDQGVDVIATKNGKIVAIQCKLYSKPVGNKAVQEVNTGKLYYKADYAAVVSNNTYTASAQQLARNCGVLLLFYDDLKNLDKTLNI